MPYLNILFGLRLTTPIIWHTFSCAPIIIKVYIVLFHQIACQQEIIENKKKYNEQKEEKKL
jgi:uncharacterized metal-binding protein